jgi:putative hydrolase of the HAD superfamily
MRASCIAFDLDDTLFLERDYVRSGFTAVGEWVSSQFGLTRFAERAWNLFQEGFRRNIFDLALEETSLPASSEMIEKMVRVYRSHVPDIRLAPDAVCCLEALRGQVRLALISDGPVESQRNKVRALALDASIDQIILTAELGAEFVKPHPRSFQLVEKLSNTSGGRCLYVGDNPAKDFSAPLQLGWRSIRVRRPDGLHASVDTPEQLAVEREMNDLSSLTELVLGSP